MSAATVDRVRKVKDHMLAQHCWEDTDTGGSITILWAKSHRDEHDPAVCRSADQWTHTHDADEWADLYQAVDAARHPRNADRPLRECASTRCHVDVTSKRSDAKYCSAHCKQFSERQAAK